MTIGVPKEVKSQEHRVGMIPASAGELVKRGHRVVVETGAGTDSSYLNAEYEAAGAEIAPTATAVFQEAELIVKVKEPQPAEVALLGEKHTLFTYLHLAADKGLTEALTASGCTAIAYETLEVAGRLPLLEPMSELAGRMAAIVGSYHLANHRGGRGILLGGVPGVAPGRVMVIGGGTAGVNAARVATGIGADVTIVEVDVERMRFLDIALQEAHTLYSTEANIASLLPRIDLIIGAVLIPGAAAPKLITREMLQQMAPGSVLVDIAIDQGGCSETSRPTTHDDPTYFEEGILHYCVANMPGAYSRTATQALSNVTTRWITLLADKTLPNACRAQPELLSGINCTMGKLTCSPVGEAHSLSAVNPAEVLELH
ncbi:MAG: alanine dehydrogenase [Roseibacillus sp.]|jgi:alanine dehydrogenase|nr:alanine dehydrogenase [Roseibacillus sp.]MBP35810.1 alanine dehydrogenase [Roseibacillus sp.]MCP4731084.1 alanine dehydrogenase [Roseibacillus sp.]MDP7308374.1 alanine dehydrogenase [Roseibacillus sp.]MDP7655622.1 alanine dehydrogenase [Roseibacillus sp.]|tara:strand:+ start:7658 stop:8773 length:1116 start_codon:yes stop_codon:yes gene_type:complete